MDLEIKTMKIGFHHVLAVKYYDGTWLSLSQLAETKEAIESGLTKYSLKERITKRVIEIKYLQELLCNRREYVDRIYSGLSSEFLTR